MNFVNFFSNFNLSIWASKSKINLPEGNIYSSRTSRRVLRYWLKNLIHKGTNLILNWCLGWTISDHTWYWSFSLQCIFPDRIAELGDGNCVDSRHNKGALRHLLISCFCTGWEMITEIYFALLYIDYAVLLLSCFKANLDRIGDDKWNISLSTSSSIIRWSKTLVNIFRKATS